MPRIGQFRVADAPRVHARPTDADLSAMPRDVPQHYLEVVVPLWNLLIPFGTACRVADKKHSHVFTIARTGSDEPIERRFRHRLPWLLLGLAGALLAADLVASFASALERNITLAFFIPAIVYLADAVGTQTETVIVRGLSVGVRMRQMAIRELLTGIAIGLVIGVVAGLLVWVRWSDPAVAIGVMTTVIAACTTATLTAMALPALFDALGRDPAFASGPLATAIQDLLSIFIYFTIATQLIGKRQEEASFLLLVPQRIDRIERRRLACGIEAEEHANASGNAERQHDRLRRHDRRPLHDVRNGI